MANNTPKVPQIRFKGFTDAWVKRELSELGYIATGSTPPTTNGSYYSADGIPWVTPTDITAGLISETPRKLSKIGESVGRIVPANTILVTCIASIGKNTMLTVRGSFNQQINSLTPFKENFPYFLLTESIFWSEAFKRSAAAATMQIINKSEFSKHVTSIPTYTEQSKIGTFFKHLDELIALYKQKHEKLQKIKKALLEKMFPKNGDTKPQIRFKGFTDAWVKWKLRECGKFKSNGVDKKIRTGEVPVNLLNYMDVYNGLNITSKNCSELMQVTAKLKQVQENNVLKNDIFFTPTSETPEDIGRVNVIEEDLDNTVYSYHLVRYRPYADVFYSVFPKYAFAHNSIRKQMILAAQGVQRFVINRSEFEELNVDIPSYTEQSKIGIFFKHLDELISLYKQKHAKLQNVKKSLLKKMFV